MPTKPEINRKGKIISGTLLIVFTIASIITIIAFWPDRLPKPGQEDGIYRMKLFQVTLDTCLKSPSLCTPPVAAVPAAVKTNQVPSIHINTLLLILVAAAGFLGNMIHIATSLTTYVGAEKFKKSWILWYFVRPVTAAGLAIILYFVLRAGFLNYSNDNGNLNLYGVLTLSVLAGLFTDIATQKLKEVFETIFKPKDQRPDKLDDTATNKDEFTVTDVSPAKLDKTKNNKITITGANLDKAQVNVVIGDTIIPQVVVKPEKMEFEYMPTAEEAQKDFALLVITDENGKTLYTKKIPFA